MMAEILTCRFQGVYNERTLTKSALLVSAMENPSLNLETKLRPTQEGVLSVLVFYPEHSGCFCITTKELLKMTEINTLPQRSQQNTNHCCLPSL